MTFYLATTPGIYENVADCYEQRTKDNRINTALVLQHVVVAQSSNERH